MAAPINNPLTGDIWHLCIDDLLAPLPEKARLGGPGPFVINLSASTAPIDLPASGIAGCQDAHVYQLQRTEDRRPRYRLRLGPFADEDAADAMLEKVRDTYPGALTATADADDLRAIGAIQAKAIAQQPPAEKAPAKAAAKRSAKSQEKPLEKSAAPEPAPIAAPLPTSSVAAQVLELINAEPTASAAAIPVLSTVVPPLQPIVAAPAVTTAPAVSSAPTQVIPVLSSAVPPPQAIAAKPSVAPAPPPQAIAAKPSVAPAPPAPIAAQPPVTPASSVSVAPAPLPMPRAPAKPVAAAAPVAAAPVAAAPVVEAAARFEPKLKPERARLMAPHPVEQVSLVELGLETTQTVRALTTLELEDDTSTRWFAIQLSLSEEAFDSDTVPNLDIFSVYRLYCVAGIDQGRIMHALRLGFFGEEMAAGAVASYLADYYDNPTVKRVSSAERHRFADQGFEPRKDIGATGRHAVIEITNERFVRERRATPRSAPITGSDSAGSADRRGARTTR
jgi:hypothetical protein